MLCEGCPGIPDPRASGSSRRNYNYYYLFVFNINAGTLINCTLTSEHTATGIPASPCSCAVYYPWFLSGSCSTQPPPMVMVLIYLMCLCLSVGALTGCGSWCYQFVQQCFSTCLAIFLSCSSGLLRSSLPAMCTSNLLTKLPRII